MLVKYTKEVMGMQNKSQIEKSNDICDSSDLCPIYQQLVKKWKLAGICKTIPLMWQVTTSDKYMSNIAVNDMWP